MIEELRISSLGVIDSSTLELGPGFTVVTGETGAGKTMVVTALGLLLGGRADSGAVRVGARQARVEGVVRVDRVAGLAAAVEEAGGEVEDDVVVLARNVERRGSVPGLRRWRRRAGRHPGRGRRAAGRRPRPVRPAPAAEGHDPARRARRLRRRRGRRACSTRYRELHGRLLATERELVEVVATARERAREADLLRFGVDEIEAVAPQPGEDLELAAEEARLGHADTLRTAAEQAREALSSEQGSPDALGAVAAARGQLDGVREHDAEAGELADRVAEVTYLLSDLAADVASYASGIDTDPARLAGVSERRAALVALTRKYGDSVDEVLAWGEQAATPAARARLDRRDDRAPHGDAGRAARRAGRGRRGACPAPARAAAERLGAAVTEELTLLAMPDASMTIEVGTARSRVRTTPSIRPRTRSSSATGGSASTATASTRSSSCWPPTPAPSRGRCTRAPPAASCPG